MSNTTGETKQRVRRKLSEALAAKMTCVQCGKQYDEYQIIDGKRTRFHIRTKCFECFPYKSRKEMKKFNTCGMCHKEFLPRFKDETGKYHYLVDRQNCLECWPPARNIEEFEEKVKENYPDKGKKWCMREYGLSWGDVQRIINKYNLLVSKEGWTKVATDRRVILPEDQKVNHEQFTNIKDPIAAYLLGLIWTDGHINKKMNLISFGTTYPDSDYFIPQFLKTGAWGVGRYKHKGKTWKDAVSIYACNSYLKDFLKQHNFTDKDKGFQSLYDIIPENLKRFFIIGLIDGDGCFYVNKYHGHYRLTIAAAYDQNWDCLSNIFKKLGIKHSISKTIRTTGHGSVIEICGKSRVKLLGDFLYHDYKSHGIGLPRKYNKFLTINEMCDKLVHKRTLNEPIESPKIYSYKHRSQNIPVL